MRWIRKALILGLAGVGAYHLFELVQARAKGVQASAGPPVNDAIDTVRSAAARVKDDLTTAQTEAAEELRHPSAPDDLNAAPEPQMAVADHVDPADVPS
jgi:hypothetical protein